ncbi:MAG: hypothetical protein ACE5GX_10955, partial [Thermoanaerobaculia bacterium]
MTTQAMEAALPIKAGPPESRLANSSVVPAESVARKRDFLLLRFGLVIGGAYVLLANSGLASLPVGLGLMILGAL